MSKNFDETVRLQSENRKIKEEKVQGIAVGASSVPRLASSSAASFPGKNECPRTHFRPILHQSTAASTWWCGPRPRLGWVKMAVGLPEGQVTSGTPPTLNLAKLLSSYLLCRCNLTSVKPYHVFNISLLLFLCLSIRSLL